MQTYHIVFAKTKFIKKSVIYTRYYEESFLYYMRILRAIVNK